MGGAQVVLHGGHLMLNTGESPNVVKESFLSQILQDSPPEKYYLSPRACLGILRRAKERGKKLPQELEMALKEQALSDSFDSLASNSMKSSNPHSGCRQVEISKCIDTTNPDPSKNQGGLAIYDISHRQDVIRPQAEGTLPCLTARAGTGGNNLPVVHCLNDQGGSQMNVTEDKTGTLRAEEHGHQPIIAFEPGIASRDGGHVYTDGKAPTLRANPGDNAPTIHSYCIAGNTIDRQLQNGGNGKGVKEEVAYTLNTIDRHAVAKVFPQQAYDKFSEGKPLTTLKASGGTYGGAARV